jgi:transitional endoplasmic reticulum ATPase
MDDLVHETKKELAEQTGTKHRKKAERALESYEPEKAAHHLREAASAFQEVASIESLPSVVKRSQRQADELRSLASRLEDQGMDAVTTSTMDGADGDTTRSQASESGHTPSSSSSRSSDNSVGGGHPDNGSGDGPFVDIETPSESFNDVGGLSDVKQMLLDKVADPIQRDELYQQYGIDPIRGVLLKGEPGTGKTLLARALGGELGWDFIELTPAQINSALVGQGAQNIQDVFELAKEHQPCILFFDEIENIAKDRTSTTQSTRSEEALLTQLLTEMNNIEEEDIVVIGATNQPEEVDDALLNARRFSEVIEIPLPDADARKAILKVHLRRPSVPVRNIDFERAAKLTEGFAGDDLEQVATNAAHNALSEAENAEDIVPITQRHLEEGIRERRDSIEEAEKGDYLGGSDTDETDSEGWSL